MHQLYFVKKGSLQWREVKQPVITSPNQALVRPFAVAKCDLDDAFLFNNLNLKLKLGSALGIVDPKYNSTFKNLLKGPFPFGHECVAEVIEVGENVKQFKVGDVVSVPFQISCGSCMQCSSGFTSVCEHVAPISTYGFGNHLEFGGAMSDVLNVPFADAMLIKIPSNVDPIHLASLSDNLPDAYRHVKELENNPDQKILIVSGKAKSVGIYALMFAKALGVKHVDYCDNNPERLQLATQLKATNLYESYNQIKSTYDLVIDASSTEQGLRAALKAVRNFGTLSSSGIYIKKTPLSLIELYAKGINFKIGFANAKTDAENILKLTEKTKIPFELVTTKLANWHDAQDAFLTESTKVIVKRNKLFK